MYAYDYYTVSLPGDVFDGDDAMDRLKQLAINEARERTKLYCIPAEWRVSHVSGEVGDFEVTFKVRRKRYYGNQE